MGSHQIHQTTYIRLIPSDPNARLEKWLLESQPVAWSNWGECHSPSSSSLPFPNSEEGWVFCTKPSCHSDPIEAYLALLNLDNLMQFRVYICMAFIVSMLAKKGTLCLRLMHKNMNMVGKQAQCDKGEIWQEFLYVSLSRNQFPEVCFKS